MKASILLKFRHTGRPEAAYKKAAFGLGTRRIGKQIKYAIGCLHWLPIRVSAAKQKITNKRLTAWNSAPQIQLFLEIVFGVQVDRVKYPRNVA